MTHVPLFTKSPLAEVLLRAALASDGIMGGRGHSYTRFLRHLFDAQTDSDSHISDRNIVLKQEPMDGDSTNSETLGNLLLRFPGEITTNNIVGVRELHFTGHVYDLQSYTTLYIANGIVSSNCLCITEYEF
jgi:hypothetical protein